MYLLKYLATAGVAARRKAEALIRDGAVAVNGQVVTEPSIEVTDADTVTVEGQPVTVEAKEYHVLNKPAGVVSTAEDTHGRPTVVDLVSSDARLYPVGRLDADTTGLILLTNDGELADRLTHPRYEVPKTYRVTVAKPISDTALRQLEQGVTLEDGPTAPAQVTRLNDTSFTITIHEGRNRQVRRMGDAVGHPVAGLRRIRLADLELGDLPEGQSRPLTASEVAGLRSASQERRR